MAVLITATRKHLRDRPRTMSYQHICQETGLTVGWLVDFASNEDRDFGCEKVERLYAFLTGKQLEVK